MASASSLLFHFLPLIALSFTLLLRCSSAGGSNSNTDTMLFTCHKGPLLRGPFSVNLIWYGNFNPAQRAIVTDFISSLSQSGRTTKPSVTAWWSSVQKYYRIAYPKSARPNSLSLSLSLGKQLLDNKYSLGKSLTSKQLRALASKAAPAAPNSVNVVLTAADVAVQGFCMSKCGSHGSIPVTKPNPPQHQGKGNSMTRRTYRYPYIWVGNSETQCPGQCAWPFHQPVYGPQGPPLVSPNNDVGLDGIIINLATLLAGTATNPFGNGCFQGPKEAPLEAASACPGVYGKGAYPGYAGNLLVDRTTGASYNANGINGRKYLLPALYDPSAQTCSTLV